MTSILVPMTQQRLNHVIIMHTHKQQTDELNLVNVAESFISVSPIRIAFFGHLNNNFEGYLYEIMPSEMFLDSFSRCQFSKKNSWGGMPSDPLVGMLRIHCASTACI